MTYTDSEELYLAELSRRQQESWPAGRPRVAEYPFGERPVTAYLHEWATRQPERAAIEFYGQTLTYAELDDLSDRLASWLEERGVLPGERVAVLLPNCPQFNVAFHGVLKRGAVFVPLSPLARGGELQHLLDEADPAALIVLDALWPVAKPHLAGRAVREVLHVGLAATLPAQPTLPLPDLLRAAAAQPAGRHDLFALLRGVTVRPQPEPTLDSPAVINFSGGTTGLPKGCLHHHRDLIYTCASYCAVAVEPSEHPVFLSFLPQFWIAGEDLGVLFPTFLGATLVLLTRWDAQAFLRVVPHYGVTITTLLVDQVDELLEHPVAAQTDFSSLRQVNAVSFMRKLNPDYRRRWAALTGSLIAEASYGMTETNTCDTFTTGFQKDDFDLLSQPTFVGLPVPGTEFKVCDFGTGELRPFGEEGELCVRSPAVYKGSWRERRAESPGGWLHTGDSGIIDEQGLLHYLGRRREMIKVSGMSVFPGELEMLLGRHPAVSGVGVLGRPHERRGEEVVAFVVPRPGHDLSAEALSEWCRAEMAAYKVPTIYFLDELPLTATGKVDKKQLLPRLAEVPGETPGGAA
ncbi:AMP-binding protein [Deinococcus sp. PESE-13]